MAGLEIRKKNVLFGAYIWHKLKLFGTMPSVTTLLASGQVGKAPVSGTGDRRFESYLASQNKKTCTRRSFYFAREIRLGSAIARKAGVIVGSSQQVHAQVLAPSMYLLRSEVQRSDPTPPALALHTLQPAQ